MITRCERVAIALADRLLDISSESRYEGDNADVVDS